MSDPKEPKQEPMQEPKQEVVDPTEAARKEKKARNLEQLRQAREIAKLKKLEKEKRLSDLEEKVKSSSAAPKKDTSEDQKDPPAHLKSDPKAEKQEEPDEADEDDEPAPKRPKVVTRQKKQEAECQAGIPSFWKEFIRTSAIAGLGLASFYVTNIWSQPMKRAQTVPTQPQSQAAATFDTPNIPSVQPVQPDVFAIPPLRTPVGKSGFFR